MTGVPKDQAPVLLGPDALDRINDVLARFDLDDELVEAWQPAVLLGAKDAKGHVPGHGVPIRTGNAMDGRTNRVLIRPVG